MTNFSTKALSLLLSLALIISAFAMVGTISASAEDTIEQLTSSDLTFVNGLYGKFASNTSSGLLTVTKGSTNGTGYGFIIRIPKLQYYPVTKIDFDITVNWANTGDTYNITCGFGEYENIQDVTNKSTGVVKNGNRGITSFTSGQSTVLSFDLSGVQGEYYDTLYMSKVNDLTDSGSLVINSVSITYDLSLRTVFKGTFNVGSLTSGNLLKTDKESWSQGQWDMNKSSATYVANATRIGIDRLIDVVASSKITFSLVNRSTGARAADTYRYVIRGYNSSNAKVNYNASNAANSSSLGGVANNAVIDLSQSNLTSIVKIGVAIYGSGTVTTDFIDTYMPSMTMTTKATSTAVKSDTTSVVTAPDLPDYSLTGYTFIGWKDSANNLYKAGSQITLTDDTTFTAVAVKVETQEGAGVRWSNTDIKRGLKFTTYISGNVDAAELKNYISPALVKTEITGNGKTVDVMNSSANDGNSAFAEESNDTTLVYHGSVTEYQSDTSMLNVDFTAQGVATVTYADGSTMELASSTTTTRNMAAVAQAAYDDLKDETTELAVSKCALLKAVYGVA